MEEIYVEERNKYSKLALTLGISIGVVIAILII
jgi:hypothetical protein